MCGFIVKTECVQAINGCVVCITNKNLHVWLCHKTSQTFHYSGNQNQIEIRLS